MVYKFEKMAKSQGKVTMSFDLQEWKDAQVKAYEKTKGRYAIPGFRRGHVPMKIIERQYGEAVFFEEAIYHLFDTHYGKIIDEDEAINPIDRASLDFKDNGEKGVDIIATFPVSPDVKLGKYKGLDIEKPVYEVTDEDVEKELKNLQERNSRTVEVTDREAKLGDTTNIDFEGFKDGVPFEGGKGSNYPLVLGSGSFIPGFEDQVVGMKVNDERDVSVTFPEDYHQADLAGKPVVFHVKVLKIEEKQLPEINDDFIKEATGDKNLDTYKKNTIKKLTKSNKDKAENELERKIMEVVCKDSEVEIPNVMIERQIDASIERLKYQLMYSGYSIEQYLEAIGQTEKQLRDSFKEGAEASVKEQLVTLEIINKEKIEVTDEDLEKEIVKRAKETNQEVEEYRGKLNEEQTNRIKDEILFEKFSTFIKKKNTKKETKEKKEEEVKE